MVLSCGYGIEVMVILVGWAEWVVLEVVGGGVGVTVACGGDDQLPVFPFLDYSSSHSYCVVPQVFPPRFTIPPP